MEFQMNLLKKTCTINFREVILNWTIYSKIELNGSHCPSTYNPFVLYFSNNNDFRQWGWWLYYEWLLDSGCPKSFRNANHPCIMLYQRWIAFLPLMKVALFKGKSVVKLLDLGFKNLNELQMRVNPLVPSKMGLKQAVDDARNMNEGEHPFLPWQFL